MDDTNKTNNLLTDPIYRNAEKLYKNKQYDEAYEEYLKLSQTYKSNKKIYKRLLDSMTHNYTYKSNNKSFKKTYDNYLISYKLLITKRELTLLNKKLSSYDLVKPSKSRFLLIAFLGYFGVHKFIEKKIVLGIVYLLTFGLFGIGVVIDLVNDYATYEDDRALDIFRYVISIIVLTLTIIKRDSIHYYYLIAVAILLTPFIFSFVLKFISRFIKIFIILILCILGLRPISIQEVVPNYLIGVWKTTNENTNYVSIDIKEDKTTINFNDRDKNIGTNEYNTETKILKVFVNETTYYKFKYDSENKRLCKYTESNNCILSFEK